MRAFKSPDEFYHSKEWEGFVRNLKLERTDENGNIICAICGKPIVRKYDCIGHHKIELDDDNVNDINVTLNPDNVDLVHFRCHNQIHERFDGLRQQVYIVHGAPCSGKTTFVRDNANRDDLIVDLDAIYKAISLCFTHDQPPRLKANVFGIRDTLYEQIRLRKGKWRNAWIISSKTALELERERELFGATLIHIDTDKETCLDNLHKDPNGRDVLRWTGYIEAYFDKFLD